MGFDIPVVLFIFRRNKVREVISRVREVRPEKVYLLADYGRNPEEIKQAEECRRIAESSIDWECEVIKNYATENRGVYGNIGKGAIWVFEREEKAIFLEDDNLPEISFFYYCKELLDRYKDENRILWICGTNYLGNYESPTGDSYMFTQHLLPCGWASWSHKFLKYYDPDIAFVDDLKNRKIAKKRYYNLQLYYQYRFRWVAERKRIKENGRSKSWDYQMDIVLKYNNLLGVSPAKNQIKNIGVDELSEHGGVSMMDEMTRRFCTMPSYELLFPLKHPEKVCVDPKYERLIAHVLLFPPKKRIKSFISCAIRELFNIQDKSIKSLLLRK